MEQGKAVFPVSVNFSRCSLAQPMFVEQLTTICDSSGISPELLEIEITESLREVEDLDIRALIIKIREAGFSVAIDDFGTEYANLALLSSVEFDVLKLDKSMVGDVAHNPRTRAIVESIAEICGKLGIRMVAEGIETEEQMAALNACGVPTGPGLPIWQTGLRRPVRRNIFTAMIASSHKSMGPQRSMLLSSLPADHRHIPFSSTRYPSGVTVSVSITPSLPR